MKCKRSAVSNRVVAAVFLLMAAGSLFDACSELDKTYLENEPPTVWLSGAPPEGSVESYTVKMFWGGWDPDGEIAYYEYCITDNAGGAFDPADTTGDDSWGKVYSNDSTFTFTADVLADSNTSSMKAEFTRSHTFFIRSVDTQGLASERPAYRSFTSRTLSPDVNILAPAKATFGPAEVPPISTFKWEATDYIHDDNSKQDPDSVSWVLEPVDNHDGVWTETIEWIRNLPVESSEWGEWAWYKAPEDSGKSWTTPPLDLGRYVFAIRAKDEAGAVTPVFDEDNNLRRVVVSPRTGGPELRVTNQYFGSITWMGIAPLAFMDLPPEVPIKFCWEASAADYGGVVVAYRYGWDISDLADPRQWDVDWTPFSTWNEAGDAVACSLERTYYAQSHTFSIEVMDNNGYISRVEIKVNIIPFTMSRNLLLVDDFDEGEWGGWNHLLGKGVLPSDTEHDDFWEDMLSDVAGFDAREDVREVNGSTDLDLRVLANYKAIVWCVKGTYGQNLDLPLLHQLIGFRPKKNDNKSGGKKYPNVLALFMAAGGHVMICGQHPVSMVFNKTYSSGVRFPAIFKYDLLRGPGGQNQPNVKDPPGDQSFPYLELCLETMDFSMTAHNIRRDGTVCPIVKIRKAPPTGLRDHTMRAAIPLDPGFPRLELRAETAAPGKAHDPDVKGLNVEVYNPEYFFDHCNYVHEARSCFEPIYGLDCFDTSEPTYSQPVAFWTSTFAHVEAEVPGAVAARSVLLGFPPVMFEPDQVRPAIEYILFDEWRLPRK
jgi:hypothetical protein